MSNLGPQAAEILERDGLNELEKPPKPTLLLLFLMQCPGWVLTADSLVGEAESCANQILFGRS